MCIRDRPFLHDLGEATGCFTQAQLMNMLAVSESTPGPIGINTVSYTHLDVYKRQELTTAQEAPVHGFEDKMVFEGCMPVEVMARRGHDTLCYGPLKPRGLKDCLLYTSTKAGQEKMTMGLIKLAEEDPTFKTYTDEETGQTIIAGMGELHLEIIVDRLLREFKVEANVGAPQVAYKETIKKAVDQDTKYARQSGGKGQYGHVKIHVAVSYTHLPTRCLTPACW